MIEVQPKTIELPIGYTDKEGQVHKRVSFGRRIAGRELFLIDTDPRSSIPTQHQDLIMRQAISEFGGKEVGGGVLPVDTAVLLRLDDLDREDLADAYQAFVVETLGGREPEVLADNRVKLALGFKHNDEVYDVVEFGNRLTGHDHVAADKRDLDGLKRACYLIGLQITKLKQSDGALELDGPIVLEWFETLDGVDIIAIRVGAERWRQSFRRPGKEVQEGDGESNLPAGQGAALERGSDSQHAGGAA